MSDSIEIQNETPKKIIKNSEKYLQDMKDIDGKVNIDQFNNINGVFVYNEKFKGIYTRASQRSIISGLHGGYSMASLLIKNI